MSFKYNPFTGNFDIVDKGGGGGSPSIGEILTGQILSSENKIIDQNLISSCFNIAYTISIYNITQNKYKSLNVSITNKTTDVDFQIFNKSGDSISIEVDSIVNSPNIELLIKNNSGFTLDYKILKIII